MNESFTSVLIVGSFLEDIAGNGLRILLLGSYDSETKVILYRLRKDLGKEFARYASITMLVETVDVHVSLIPGLHDYVILFERREDGGGTALILKGKTKIVESIEYKNEDEFRQRIGSDSSNTINLRKFRKLSQLEKVSLLGEWSDVIYLIRQLEATRGGEFVELVYLLGSRHGISAQDPLKYEFFYKKGIEISTMMKEIISYNKIEAIPYNDYNGLWEAVFIKTNYHISRLNTQFNRFKEFENQNG